MKELNKLAHTYKITTGRELNASTCDFTQWCLTQYYDEYLCSEEADDVFSIVTLVLFVLGLAEEILKPPTLH